MLGPPLGDVTGTPSDCPSPCATTLSHFQSKKPQQLQQQQQQQQQRQWQQLPLQQELPPLPLPLQPPGRFFLTGSVREKTDSVASPSREGRTRAQNSTDGRGDGQLLRAY